jgi:hypothetical protein
LPTFANYEVPCSNPVPGIPWNYVTVRNIEKWPAATFCEKTTKATDRDHKSEKTTKASEKTTKATDLHTEDLLPR